MTPEVIKSNGHLISGAPDNYPANYVFHFCPQSMSGKADLLIRPGTVKTELPVLYALLGIVSHA